MKINATEFKAKCLSLIDRVHDSGESVVITKRGRIVARLVPEGETDDRPWLKLRHTARWKGDPLEPAVDEEEV